MPNLAHFLRDRTTGNLTSLALAAAVGGVYALVVGAAADAALRASPPASRRSRVLEITHNVLRY